MINTMEDDGLLQDFFADVDGSFSDQLAEALDLAKEGAAAQAVEMMLRPLHTIKGTAGFLGMSEVSTFTHALEDYLKSIQSGEREPDTKLMARGVDVVFALLERSRYGEELESTGYRDLAGLLKGGDRKEAALAAASGVTVENRGNVTVIRVRMPRVHLPKQYIPIIEAMEKLPAESCVLLDLEGVRTLSSTTWGAMRGAADRLRIAVCELSQACRSTFYAWGFDAVMQAYDAEQDFWDGRPD